MKLSIDSANNLETIIKLDDTEYRQSCSSPRKQDVLGAIVQALLQQNKQFSDVEKIEVVLGPGSFTGLRVGVAIANALSFALHVPVNDLPLGSIVLPEYGAPPSITLPSKR